jgi:hypothetical protein
MRSTETSTTSQISIEIPYADLLEAISWNNGAYESKEFHIEKPLEDGTQATLATVSKSVFFPDASTTPVRIRPHELVDLDNELLWTLSDTVSLTASGLPKDSPIDPEYPWAVLLSLQDTLTLNRTAQGLEEPTTLHINYC